MDGIRWYGLAYLAGFVCAYFSIRIMAKKGTTAMKLSEIADFITMIAVGTMVGGRLGYAIFYSPQLLTDFTSSPPFWGVLRVYEGGMASHGGIIGVIAVCVWWARSRKLDIFHVIDLVTLGGALGIFFGRMANYVNGELWGRPAPAGLAWAVKFPQEMFNWTRESIARLNDVTPAVVSLSEIRTQSGETIKLTAEAWQNWVSHYQNDVTSWNMVNAVIEKLIVATQSGNEQVRSLLEPVLTARYPSQLIEGFLEGLVIFIILAIVWMKPRKPGVISAIFGLCYATARIISEQYRMPDAHIGFQWLGLTRGQWLSIPMFIGVAIYAWYVLRRPSQPMGGWTTLSKTKKKS